MYIRILLLPYLFLIWLPVFLTITALTALITIVGCVCGGERIFGYYPGAIWSRLVCIISLCRVKVTGKEKLNGKQSYIFVSNHQGSYDIFLIFGYIGQSIKWVMKQSLRKIPLVGYACERAGFIFVDNSSPKAAAKTVQIAEAKLQNGASVVIFPEGSRTSTGKMSRFKKGAYQMALDLKLPIVPITINGSFRVLPIHTYFPHPHTMELIIHDPIETASIQAENIREITVKIKDLIDESRTAIESGLWEEYR
ncbi:MAG: 1-acyl-sn-glycerol-3-phosphate acyltransferase [Dysgonamonadaceae bacterium]|jgi:1-acyl-sn-glycerol-3-phosphate acyltransferase|nr:1-acyl-sn-glycerol-3-phosphate acyltransferase [Dysgonamonadaceae bacterium]